MSGIDDLLAATEDLELTDSDEAPNWCTCPDCGQGYSGADRSGGHCRGGGYGGCCQSFASNYAGEKHRTGRYDAQRRCLTPDELTAKGWTQDESGAWRTPAPANNPWKKEMQ